MKEQKVTNKLEELLEKASIGGGNITKRDLKGIEITSTEARFLVERYYDMQKARIATGNQKFANEQNETESGILKLIVQSYRDMEDLIRKILDIYVDSHPVGQWLKSIIGIGPVLAAGLLAYIDMSKAQTAGAIWKYAGWDVGYKRPKRGVKQDYNPKFRTLCWKIGDCFIKCQNNKNDIYGHLYKEKKEWYIEKNEAGGFADKAAYELSLKNYKTTSEPYKYYSEGKLPAGHINAMASRFAVKIFLSHLFEVWYKYEHNGEMPPKPFVEEHMGHVHIIKAPNMEIIDNYIATKA